MQTKNLLKVGAVGALLAGTAAWAGYTATYYVTVNTTTRTAFGSLANARASADTQQLISCSVHAFNSGSSGVTCEAQDANGVNAYCTSSAAAMVNAVASISGDAYLLFKYDTNGTCTYLYVSNASSYAPRQP
ncbi:hypothetical protein HPC49_50480 [Pyxidicoccus fallax]|uniref:Uncharacterized protein n=1 Tax=Pyxidicoccus fallax TaxID=394095 RepID=A0A848LZ04_9BACT|nr:hypothetical protein [Pyxidicoccus fallax]NMO23325.1 hypothetical protein [Pyxidicoccus fallax]NPC86402.1 hypothetical protein [Pyxidicoccus fallax]